MMSSPSDYQKTEILLETFNGTSAFFSTTLTVSQPSVIAITPGTYVYPFNSGVAYSKIEGPHDVENPNTDLIRVREDAGRNSLGELWIDYWGEYAAGTLLDGVMGFNLSAYLSEILPLLPSDLDAEEDPLILAAAPPGDYTVSHFGSTGVDGIWPSAHIFNDRHVDIFGDNFEDAFNLGFLSEDTMTIRGEIGALAGNDPDMAHFHVRSDASLSMSLFSLHRTEIQIFDVAQNLITTFETSDQGDQWTLDTSLDVDSGRYYYKIVDTSVGRPAFQYSLNLSVDFENAPPVARDDSYTTLANDTLTIPDINGLLANDSDADGDNLSATALGGATNGTLNISSDGGFTYTPRTEFTGREEIAYEVSDGSDTAQGTLVIDVTNEVPQAANDTATTSRDTAVTLSAVELTGNDSDADGDTLTIVSVGNARDGQVQLDNDGSVTFTPDAGYSGPARFDYTVEDGRGGEDTARVDVTVEATNRAPELSPDSYSTSFGADLNVGAAEGVLANDIDPDPEDILWVTDTGSSSLGTLEMEPDGAFIFTPNPGASGQETVSYTVTDGTATTQGTITLTVGENAPPVARDDSYTTLANDTLTIPDINGLLANDSDADGDTLTIVFVDNAQNGQAQLDSNGSVTFTPDAGYSGPAGFDYTVEDGRGGTASATVDVVVAGTDPPDLLPPTNFIPDPILEVTFDAGVEDSSSNGFSVQATGTRPAEDRFGTPDHAVSLNGFSEYISLSEAAFNAAEGTISIWVNPDDQSSGSSQIFSSADFVTPSGTRLYLNFDADQGVGGLFLNYRFDPVNVSLDQWTHLALAWNDDVASFYVDGVLAETTSGGRPTIEKPTLGAYGDGFNNFFNGELDDFKAFGQVLSAEEVGLLADASPSAPSTSDYSLIPERTPVSEDYEGIIDDKFGVDAQLADWETLSNRYKEEGEGFLRATGLVPNGEDGIHGAAVTVGGERFWSGDRHYFATWGDVSSGFLSHDSVNYDGVPLHLGSWYTDKSILAELPKTEDDNNPNTPPYVSNDTATTSRDTAVTLSAVELTGNDSDADGDTLTIVSVGNARNGQVQLDNDGSVTFTPDAGYSGPAGFDYTVEDGRGGTESATVAVEVATDSNTPEDESQPKVSATQNMSDAYILTQTSGTTYNGDESDQTYSINPFVIDAGGEITIIDQGGTNSIELPTGLEVAGSTAIFDQLILELNSGTSIDIRGADMFIFKTEQSLSAGDATGPDFSFEDFSENVLGITLDGNNVVEGGALTIGSNFQNISTSADKNVGTLQSDGGVFEDFPTPSVIGSSASNVEIEYSIL